MQELPTSSFPLSNVSNRLDVSKSTNNQMCFFKIKLEEKRKEDGPFLFFLKIVGGQSLIFVLVHTPGFTKTRQNPGV